MFVQTRMQECRHGCVYATSTHTHIHTHRHTPLAEAIETRQIGFKQAGTFSIRSEAQNGIPCVMEKHILAATEAGSRLSWSLKHACGLQTTPLHKELPIVPFNAILRALFLWHHARGNPHMVVGEKESSPTRQSPPSSQRMLICI